MALLTRLGARHLRLAVTSYRTALRAHQAAINRLNVYPVPDGDTGTNMALTLESVVEALDGADGMAETCSAMAHGSLMGARGNSGVILSQILRGLAERFSAADEVTGTVLAEALGRASQLADAAVLRPVEGTILTVARAAAGAAAEAAAAGGSLAEVAEAARARAASAVDETPAQLAVLADNGVVDAGGVGFVLLLDALLHAIAERPLPEPAPVEPGPPGPPGPAAAPAGGAGATGEAGEATDQRYEVMYLLEADHDAAPALKEAWAAIGGSIVVVGGLEAGRGLWNCHIHTDDIGAAVEAALDAGGRPRRIRVTDLHEQVAAEGFHGGAPPAAPGGGAGPGATATTAVVAVASGEGLERLFASLGVAAVVAGGQSMNPSTAELLAAVDAVAAGQVVLLPNNANIVPVARQVDALTAKAVHVVPTTGVAEGLAALLPFDAAATAAANAAAMAEAAGRVVSGEVARAVRPSATAAGPVAEGDWLGLSGGEVRAVAPAAGGPAAAAAALLDALVGEDHELVTVVAGEQAGDDETAAVVAWLAEHRPAAAVEVHAGGQPVYHWLFAAE